MERRWDLDLTYVTERILAAAFPARPDEQRHRGHLRELAHVLQSKHRDKYLVGTCGGPTNERTGRSKWGGVATVCGESLRWGWQGAELARKDRGAARS